MKGGSLPIRSTMQMKYISVITKKINTCYKANFSWLCLSVEAFAICECLIWVPRRLFPQNCGLNNHLCHFIRLITKIYFQQTDVIIQSRIFMRFSDIPHVGSSSCIFFIWWFHNYFHTWIQESSDLYTIIIQIFSNNNLINVFIIRFVRQSDYVRYSSAPIPPIPAVLITMQKDRSDSLALQAILQRPCCIRSKNLMPHFFFSY